MVIKLTKAMYRKAKKYAWDESGDFIETGLAYEDLTPKQKKFVRKYTKDTNLNIQIGAMAESGETFLDIYDAYKGTICLVPTAKQLKKYFKI